MPLIRPLIFIFTTWLIPGFVIVTGLVLSYMIALGDSAPSPLRTTLAIGFLVFIILILCLKRFSIRRYHQSLLILAGLWIWALIDWLSIQPSNQRTWQQDVEKLAYAEIDSPWVNVHNIRNFSYRSEFDYQPAYYDKPFNLDELQGVDLFAVYWMGPAISHIILSFDFGNDQHLAVSIEARKETGEGYSTLNGFFRQYELIYVVADERDLIGLRTHYRQDPPEQVYRYRLHVPIENVRRLFLEYIKQINELNQNPAFYNTLTENCSSSVWLMSRVNTDHVPFSWKILLSGYVPEYLYESGKLDTSQSFAELQQMGYVNPKVEQMAIDETFSRRIRVPSLMPSHKP